MGYCSVMTENQEPTKAELQDQAREAGVPVSGTKDEIAERLAEIDDETSTSDRIAADPQAVMSEVSQSAVDTANRVVEEGWQSATSGKVT